MKILAIGTWASGLKPGKRNTTYLIDSDTLLDCGPHTAEYLIDKHVDISGINRILVTHMHLDHAGGIPELVWQRGLHSIDTHINIVGPDEIYRGVTGILGFFHTPDFMMKGVTFNNMENNLKIMPGIHSLDEYMYRLDLSGKSIFYSGDTSYTDAAVEIGRNCDLFIHEATYQDTMENEAIKYGHSTVSDALKAFKGSESRIFMPTHMSIESFRQISAIKDKNIIVPEDGKEYYI